MSQSRSATIGWSIVFVLGAIGLVVNGALQPKGFGKQYVRTETLTFVEATVAPPIGSSPTASATKPANKWFPSTSSELERPNVSLTNAPPISWDSVTVVPAERYWSAAATANNGAAVTSDGATYSFSWKYTIGLWLAAFFTLAILSFLWRDNPVYKVAESVIIGVSAAYWMVLAFWSTLVPKLMQPLMPQTVQYWAMPGTSGTRDGYLIIALIPFVLGIMLLMRLSRKGGWIASWPIAFVVGTTAGLKLISHVQADFLAQISNSVVPLAVETNGVFDWGASLGNIVLIVGILTVLTYFFFSLEHKGAVGRVARVGVWFLMISFGAAFAFTVMGRITLLSERFEFLFGDWLWLIDPQKEHTFDASTMTQAIGTLVSLLR